jgi:mercuric ion transport protein
LKSQILATAGSVAGGFVAALCCIGPVVLAGAGTAGMFTAFGDYRPYVIRVVLVLLGVSFYYAYRKREVECEDGTCKIESAGKWNKIGVWISAAVVVLLILFPYIGFVPAAVFDETAEPTTEVVLTIDGMTCTSCAAGIERVLAGAKGISDANLSYQSGVGIIKIDEHLISVEELVEKVNETGFRVAVVNRKTISNY